MTEHKAKPGPFDKRKMGRMGKRLIKMSDELNELRLRLLCQTDMVDEANALSTAKRICLGVGNIVDKQYGGGW